MWNRQCSSQQSSSSERPWKLFRAYFDVADPWNSWQIHGALRAWELSSTTWLIGYDKRRLPTSDPLLERQFFKLFYTREADIWNMYTPVSIYHPTECRLFNPYCDENTSIVLVLPEHRSRTRKKSISLVHVLWSLYRKLIVPMVSFIDSNQRKKTSVSTAASRQRLKRISLVINLRLRVFYSHSLPCIIIASRMKEANKPTWSSTWQKTEQKKN